MVGAEKLLGKGDMLYAGAVDPFPIRMQGAFVSEDEVEAVVAHVKTVGAPDYIDDEIFYDDEEEEMSPSLFSDVDDPLYDKALEIVMQQGKASASYIQRRLKIGYNRAARIVEQMAEKGVVGPAQGSKPRELLRGV
jgi:S-DNA-T family DNA segregation ATPase FtsK/SpoIIIE